MGWRMQALHPPCPAVPQSAGGVFPRGSAGVFRLVSQPSDGRCEYLKELVYQTSRPRGRDAGLHAGVAAAPVGVVSPARADRLAQGSAAAPGRAARGRVGDEFARDIFKPWRRALSAKTEYLIRDIGMYVGKDIGHPVSAAALVDVHKRAAKRHIRQYAAADRLCADRGHAGQTRFPSRSTRSSSPSI